MNPKKFRIKSITRIQNPYQYKTYYFSREYFLEKKKFKDKNVPDKDKCPYDEYFPFVTREAGKTDDQLREEYKEEAKEESKSDPGTLPTNDYNSLDLDICEAGEKFLFYVPRTTERVKNKKNVQNEYQMITEILQEKEVIPLHTKNAEIKDPEIFINQGTTLRKPESEANPSSIAPRPASDSEDDNSNDSEDIDTNTRANKNKENRPYDQMTFFGMCFLTNIGDDANYFTVNTDPGNPTIL